LSEPQELERWVLVALILRPRGNKGEVVAELLTDFASRFSNLQQIYLRKQTEEPRAAGLRNFWVDRNHPGMGIFHFAESGSISDAEKLRGYQVLLPIEERTMLPAGQYFVSDLIGCSVWQGESSTRLGVVRDVFFSGETVNGTPLLQVEKDDQSELLIPLAQDICPRIDIKNRRIDVRLPEGLGDLNVRESR
jgi:16S rRNA processing protein RimM